MDINILENACADAATLFENILYVISLIWFNFNPSMDK